jgi:hypothetical protein
MVPHRVAMTATIIAKMMLLLMAMVMLLPQAQCLHLLLPLPGTPAPLTRGQSLHT